MSLFSVAEFDRAVHRLTGLPPDIGAEVAFAGRSNAGKSSAINALVNRRHLASVSRTPGRTRSINFYSLGGRGYLVDLPGYGYAAVSRSEQSHWDQLISAYLSTRRALRGLILICDVRRPLTALDHQLIAWIAPRALPVHVLLTKSDKLARGQAERALHAAQAELERQYAGHTVQLFSSTTRTGAPAAQKRVLEWLK